MRTILLLLALLPGLAHAAIEWRCDFKDLRAGRVDTIVWWYCFGVDHDAEKVFVRARVYDALALDDATEQEVVSWSQGRGPDLWARAPSATLWTAPKVAAARAEMQADMSAEIAAGRFPLPRMWRVAPNPSSTTVPPTRPMWDATGAKAVAERAYVGDRCDCSAPLVKGTQTLCPLRQLGDIAPTTNRAACAKQ